QAEDGIRDLTVTGVQTCALPISTTWAFGGRFAQRQHHVASCAIAVVVKAPVVGFKTGTHAPERGVHLHGAGVAIQVHTAGKALRSEERRVGKGDRAGWAAERRER